jgi:hypothetical protein
VWCACEDSVAFAEAILDEVEESFCVNTFMVFATGESNGGLMTFEVGQKLAHRIAAIVPIEAAPHIGFNFAPEKGPEDTVRTDTDRVFYATLSCFLCCAGVSRLCVLICACFLVPLCVCGVCVQRMRVVIYRWCGVVWCGAAHDLYHEHPRHERY